MKPAPVDCVLVAELGRFADEDLGQLLLYRVIPHGKARRASEPQTLQTGNRHARGSGDELTYYARCQRALLWKVKPATCMAARVGRVCRSPQPTWSATCWTVVVVGARIPAAL